MTRTHTPDRTNPDGTTTITTQRACNGCGTRIGDATEQETARGINGLPLPDVRKECPTCGPTAPEPACRPTRILGGYPACLESDCDHDQAPGSDLCDAIEEHVICVTHSEIADSGDITHPEFWPCKHASKATP